jgi:POT family proton-dependent oligopeptide transporter
MNHPRSLNVFFLTEMWERYGFYVVQSLLALYLVTFFKWSDAHVYSIVGSFTALTYLSPIIGGYIADNYLGQKRSILLGAAILCLSYLILSIHQSKLIIFATLSGIAVGTGLLKPNISSLLGNQYDINAKNREQGFTIFYMGVTSGIILGTTLPSHLKLTFGWSVTFFSATIGLLLGMLVFTLGTRFYGIHDYINHPLTTRKLMTSAFYIILLWSISFLTLTYPLIANIFFFVAFIFCIYTVLTTAKKQIGDQQIKTYVIGLLCLMSTLFWAFYFQMFLSLTLFIHRAVLQTWLGIHFPPPFYVTIQSIGMIVFGFFIAKKALKNKSVRETGHEINFKFLSSVLLISVGYGWLYFLTYLPENGQLLSPLMFIPMYLLISIAELRLSPVGLSAMTYFSSKNNASTMTGIFFVSLGLGAFLSGKLALLTAIKDNAPPLNIMLPQYQHGFFRMFLVSLAVSLLCGLLYFIINAQLKKLSDDN